MALTCVLCLLLQSVGGRRGGGMDEVEYAEDAGYNIGGQRVVSDFDEFAG